MMVRLIGVPRYVAERWRAYWREPVLDRLWQLSLVALIVGAAYLMIASAGVFLAFVGGTVLSILFADDIRKLVADLWNRRWAEVKLNLT